MPYIILRNVPKDEASLDLRYYPIKGGFRGFRRVYEGIHYISIKTFEGTYTGFWCFAKDDKETCEDDVIVKVYNEETKKIENDTLENTERFKQMALSYAMDDVLVEAYKPAYDEWDWIDLSARIEDIGHLPELRLDNTYNPEQDKDKSTFSYMYNEIYQGNVDVIYAEFQYAFLRMMIGKKENKDPDAVKRWHDMLKIIYNADMEEVKKYNGFIIQWSHVFVKQIIFLLDEFFSNNEDAFIYETLVTGVENFTDNMMNCGMPKVKGQGVSVKVEMQLRGIKFKNPFSEEYIKYLMSE